MNEMDDLRLLRSFVRIAESGSISAAARSLNLPQPTISRHLRQLEKSTGVVLIRRDTHALSLTPLGERLLLDARDLLARAGAAAERLREGAVASRGHLRILSVVDSGQWLVPRLLAAFLKEHPGVTAELHLMNRPSNFTREGFDCGILVGGITDPSVAVRKICDVDRILVVAPALLKKHGRPKHPADLEKLPWMGVLQPHFEARDHIQLQNGRRQIELRFSASLLLDSVTAMREAAIAGAGVAMQPKWLASSALADGTLVTLLPEWKVPPVQMSVVFPTGSLPGTVRTFVDYAAKHLPGLVQEPNH